MTRWQASARAAALSVVLIGAVVGVLSLSSSTRVWAERGSGPPPAAAPTAAPPAPAPAPASGPAAGPAPPITVGSPITVSPPTTRLPTSAPDEPATTGASSPTTTLPELLVPAPPGEAPDETTSTVPEGEADEGLSASSKLGLAVGGLLAAAAVIAALTVAYFLKTRPGTAAAGGAGLRSDADSAAAPIEDGDPTQLIPVMSAATGATRGAEPASAGEADARSQPAAPRPKGSAAAGLAAGQAAGEVTAEEEPGAGEKAAEDRASAGEEPAEKKAAGAKPDEEKLAVGERSGGGEAGEEAVGGKAALAQLLAAAQPPADDRADAERAATPSEEKPTDAAPSEKPGDAAAGREPDRPSDDGEPPEPKSS